MRKILPLFILIFFSLQSIGQIIKVNQIGFFPQSKKVAVVPAGGANSFQIISPDGGMVYYSGILNPGATWSYSNETVRLADFSSFTENGHYKIRVEGLGTSEEFEIGDNVNEDLVKGAIKAFYYNRASTELNTIHAGNFARSLGHPDTRVYIHSSAATTGRPAGTIISSPKGWYDAGDYNKYIVNSGISTYTLLALYEHFPTFYNQLDLNIPESDNGIPDLLDECLWNIEWMITMQDQDGGVYHKLTTKQFCGEVMPNRDLADRYVVSKTTAATLDFAAVMAVTARIFKNFETVRPGFSRQCEVAAVRAWNWAKANPAISYTQPSDIGTGTYGDRNFSDEFDWAGAELYILTKDESYLTYSSVMTSPMNVPSWPNVAGLTWISLAHHRNSLTSGASKTIIENKIIAEAENLYNGFSSSAYNVSMGNSASNFVWGSNSVAGNQGMILFQAYKISNDTRYLNAAVSNLDYLLGRNPTGYSYVTGFGRKTPMQIHHRPSEADGILDPVPGFLAGGPHTGKQDGCVYPSNCLAATCYVDNYCSYATNEVAINWNAPLAYLAGAIQATYGTLYSQDCAGVTGGGSIINECGRCLMSTDPVFGTACSVTASFNPKDNANNSISVFPNPFNDYINVLLNESSAGYSEVTICDLKGNILYQIKLNNQDKLRVNPDLEQGVYLLKVVTDADVRVLSIMKK